MQYLSKMTEVRKIGIDHIGIAIPFYCNNGNGNFLFHQRSEMA